MRDLKNQKMNVLGTEWNILFETIKENDVFATCDGYCDPSVKKIHVRTKFFMHSCMKAVYGETVLTHQFNGQ